MGEPMNLQLAVVLAGAPVGALIAVCWNWARGNIHA